MYGLIGGNDQLVGTNHPSCGSLPVGGLVSCRRIQNPHICGVDSGGEVIVIFKAKIKVRFRE